MSHTTSIQRRRELQRVVLSTCFSACESWLSSPFPDGCDQHGRLDARSHLPFLQVGPRFRLSYILGTLAAELDDEEAEEAAEEFDVDEALTAEDRARLAAAIEQYLVRIPA